jgi:uncharacterized integral membrane protein
MEVRKMRTKIKHGLLAFAVAMLFLAPMSGLAQPADAPSEPATTVATQPSSTPEPLSTGESAMPVAPDASEIPGLITEVVELIKNKQWPAAIALMIVILMGILKMDIVNNLLTEYVPKRILPIIPLTLGAIAGAITGFLTGGLAAAAQIVVESGVLAIVFHQIWSHTVAGKDSGGD